MDFIPNLKYGLLVLVMAVACVNTILDQPTAEQRVAATAATEEILELYNADDIDEIVSRLIATPNPVASPEQQVRFQRGMLRLLRRTAGRCSTASAGYEVSDLTSELRVEVSVKCERAKVGLNFVWVERNDQLLLDGLMVAPETAESIPELRRYVLPVAKERFSGKGDGSAKSDRLDAR